jgi:hypothetical protein
MKNTMNQYKSQRTGFPVLSFVWLISYYVFFQFLSLSGLAEETGNIKSIVLQSQKLPFTPDEFYIAAVIDEREDKGPVAWLLPLATAAESTAPKAVDIEGGGLAGIQTFINRSLPADKKLRPLVLRLQECRIAEEAGEGNVVEGRVTLALAFDMQKGDERISLGTYRGGARYKRSAGHYGVVEPALRRSLITALTYVNDWMEQEAPTNFKLAKGVKVEFIDYEVETADTVFYSSHRSLVWEDFKARPRANRFAAEVFPTFSYKGDSRVEDGYIHLQLQLKVFVLKHSSWVKEGSKDAYGLNHEQRHFDLVKLVAERFRQKVLSMPLDPEDYDGRIGYQYLVFFREMNRLQEAYDGETAHGMNKVAQERWNKKIKADLSALSEKQDG